MIMNPLKSLSRVPLCSVLLSLVVCMLLFLSAIEAKAGTPFETKAVAQPPIQPTEPWHIVVGVPAWLTFLTGDIGINGVKTHVDISPTDILRHTNFLSSLEGEVSKGRVGIRGEYLYLNAAEGVFGNGLVYKVDLHLREFAAGLGVSYRIIQGPKGWFDLRAGLRYTNLFQEQTIHSNDQSIDTASTQLVNTVGERIGSALEPIIQQNIVDKLQALQDRNPALPVGPLAGRRPGIIRDLVQSEIQSRLADLTAAVRAGVQARVNQIKAQLSSQIASTLKSQLNRSFERIDDWFDPWMGLRARYNFTKAFYVTGYADVGGFGIGADITTQVSGAFGCQITRNIFSEIGYRYLYDDYDSNGFLYRVSIYGPELTLGVNF
jgi:hypothetical protein